jgi:hypothetical protein
MRLAYEKIALLIIMLTLAVILYFFNLNIQKSNNLNNLYANYIKNENDNILSINTWNLITKKNKFFNLNIFKKPLTFDQLRSQSNGQWIVNKQVLQYSAYAIFKGNSIKIESLVFLNLGNNGNLKCVVTDSKFQILTRLTVIKNLQILPPVHKITCEWPNSTFNLGNDIMVGIIIENDFDFNLTLKDYKNNEMLSFEAIQFHLAKKFNADKPKKQSIAHCVHMFYGVDDIKSNSMIKFSNWVELQRNIGIDRIRIYVLKLEKKTCDYLNEKYKNFIDLVDHPTKFESICGLIEKLNNLEPDKIIYDVLFKNCKNAFNKVFSPIEGKPSLYKKSGIFF